ncbi:MAG TPA: hypothetical protein VK862_05880 [Afifellaceae bacterium]|nr:hypothetical protein [Afifellaceae bacterium]
MIDIGQTTCFPVKVSTPIGSLRDLLMSVNAVFAESFLALNGAPKIYLRTDENRFFPAVIEMIEYSERGEVGRVVIGKETRKPSTLTLVSELDKIEKVEKLQILLDGVCADSGIRFQTRNGKRLVVVASAFACHFSFFGDTKFDGESEPEFALTEYAAKET